MQGQKLISPAAELCRHSSPAGSCQGRRSSGRRRCDSAPLPCSCRQGLLASWRTALLEAPPRYVTASKFSSCQQTTHPRIMAEVMF